MWFHAKQWEVAPEIELWALLVANGLPMMTNDRDEKPAGTFDILQDPPSWLDVIDNI